MAGLGRKTFIATEVLTAANVNGYLMDQSVMKFASSAARSSAIGTAVSEGMVSYLADTDALEVYNGSSWGAVSSSSSGNAVINGAFDIWQRGTSFNSAVYSADRWVGFNDKPTVSQTQQSFTPGSAPVAGYESQFFFRYASTAGGSYDIVEHRVEDVRSFAGQTVTLSYWAKANATVTNTPSINHYFGTGGSSDVITLASSATITTSWQRFTHTVTLPAITGKTIGASNSLRLQVVRVVDALAHTIDIWGVQLEAGSVATPFRRSSPTLQGELAACQRYYQRTLVISGTEMAVSTSGSSVILSSLLPVEMRTDPSSSTTMTNANYGAGNWTFVQAGIAAVTKSGTVTIGNASRRQSLQVVFTGATYSTTPNGWQNLNNSSGIYVELSAEL